MKYAFYIKFADEIGEAEILNMVSSEVKNQKVIKLKHGIGLSGKNIMFGFDSDDFVNCLYTCVVRFNAHRIPRFVANSRLKQINA